MALRKIIGTETEYGVTVTGPSDVSPVLVAGMLVGQYGAAELRRVKWDFQEENPLRDARGFEGARNREAAEEEGALVNLVLTNGARYYVDHAHPEFSTPETTNPRDCVLWDKAGEAILYESIRRASEVMPPGARVHVYKNNSDGKGNSYGTHENYLVDRAVPFARLSAALIPFFVTRQVFTGAGKVGSEEPGANGVTYQLTQRADFIEAEVGLETTLKRPIVNTRDEPHADADRFRRLHVILGDANMSEVATFLKVGTTALILMLVEDGALDTDAFTMAAPVAAIKDISRDPDLRTTVELSDGRRVTALEHQWEYLEAVKRYLKTKGDDLDVDPEWPAEVVSRWEYVLAGLEADPMTLERELDWVAKRALLEGYRERHGLAWNDPKLRMVDLQYHDVDPDRGLYHRLVSADRVERLVGDDEVRAAMTEPPTDTRAYFRGRCLARYATSLVAASWDALIFDLDGQTLKRIPMLDPHRGTEAHTRALIEAHADPRDLVEALQG
ncbi:MAG TPA: depupylase/deamidase Dop [Actinomycetota bacterium]|nr:depupylase/deamidase Dop [Actinomycetota bacterium]